MAESELRQRKAKPAAGSASSKSKSASTDNDDSYSPGLDIIRVLSFLVLASCALSYFISSGESFFWGMKDKPDYMKVAYWKEKINGPPPPLYLTDDELIAYDGRDPDKPIYVAVNGTIFDVSMGRHIYGKGGSYNVFAGRDASRAYITGCFAEDQTPDLRGVEVMYLPLDDPERDASWTSAEMQEMREKELAFAKQRAFDALKHWVDFFGMKYKKIGYVKREDDWLNKLKKRDLCSTAAKGRKIRQRRED